MQRTEFETKLARVMRVMAGLDALSVRLDAIEPEIEKSVLLRTMYSNIRGTIDHILFSNALDNDIDEQRAQDVITRMEKAMAELEQLVKAGASPKPESHANPGAPSSDNKSC